MINEYEALTGEAKHRYDLALYIYEGHKDAYGIKGRHYGFFTGEGYEVDAAWTTEALEAEAARISDAVGEEIERERAAEARAVAEFEAAIERTIAIGAGDRETAIRWLKEAYDDGYSDNGYIEYSIGLPYGYFARAAA